MRMFNSKKGVSEVVANVLIVLLVIVGIAVIWSVVKPTIDKGASGIKSDCFTLSVEPVSCAKGAAAGDPTTVVVKRNPGAGTFNNLELVFQEGTQTKSVSASPAVTSTSLGELSSTTIIVPAASLTGINPSKVNLALRDASGNLCQITTQPVNCA